MSEEKIFNTPNLLDEFYTLLLKYKNNKSISKTKLFKQEMFTNKAHYLIFKHLPRPSEIYRTQSYIMLRFLNKRKEFGEEITYYNDYVVGLNSDNRLFIIKPVSNFEDFVKIDDCAIRLKLGYTSEIENNVIVQDNVYRLQGDILGSVVFQEDLLQAYRTNVGNTISRRISTILEEIIRNRIVDLLLDFGLTPEINRFTINIFCIPRRYVNIPRLTDKLATYLIKNLYINDLYKTKIEHEILDGHSRSKIIKYYCSEDKDVSFLNIYIEKASGRFGEHFEPICIMPTTLSLPQIEEITKKINPEISKQRFPVGRHIIEYNGYPSGFSIVWKPSELEHERIINVDLYPLLFVKSGTLTIRHPEHGTTDLNIVKDATIEIFAISLNRNYIQRTNYYRVKDYLK